MQYNKEKKEIISKKELSELDKFALNFLKIIEKHTEYVIVAGYISILLGRARATEDIDIFIKKITKEQFSNLYKELQEKKFWCLNAEKEEDLFEYLKDNLAIRFSKKELPVPNFEVKFPKDTLDEQVFEDSILVNLSEGKLRISSLERHIAFKELYLGSDKDIEDAKHVEELFKNQINKEKINKIKELIKQRNKKWKIKNKEFL